MNISLSEKQKSLLVRSVMVALSIGFSIVFTHMMFIVYMWEAGFFAYDMFDVGSTGLEIFYAFTIVSLLLGAVLVCGAFIPFMRKLHGGPLNRSWFSALLVLNALVIFPSLIAIIATGAEHLFTWALVLAFFILLSWHLEAMLFEPTKIQFKTLTSLFVFSLVMCILRPDAMARIWQFPLRHFGVGGALWVTVSDREAHLPMPIEGNLILLTPRTLYIKAEGEDQITIVPISAALKITTDRERSFKDETQAKDYIKKKGFQRPKVLDWLERAASDVAR